MAEKTSLMHLGGTVKMSFRERWAKKFAESLTKDEKKSFRLRLDFEGKCARMR